MTDFLLHTGLDYPANPDAPRAEWTMVRHEAGETVSDLPAISIPWLRDGGLIEEVAPPEATPDLTPPPPEATSGSSTSTEATNPEASPDPAPPVREAASAEPLPTDAVLPPASATPPVADGTAAPDAAGVSGEAAPAQAPEVNGG